MSYIFNGDWFFDLELNEIATLHSDTWFMSEKQKVHKSKLNNGLVPVQILDQRNYEPDPSMAQIATINYIIENQHKILIALLNALITEIIPFYVEAIDDDEWVPTLNTINDLGELIGIYSVLILPDEKKGSCYYRLDFEYLGDEESSLAIIFHKDKFIGHNSIRHMAYECISIDLGLEKNAVLDGHRSNSDFGIDMVHSVIPKYGKLKPWQEEATYEFLRNLLYDHKNEEFVKTIESNKWDINFRFNNGLSQNCVDLAANVKNPEMISNLISKGGNCSKSVLECIGLNFHKESLKVLVDNGSQIDQLTYWDVTALKDEIFKFIKGIIEINNQSIKGEMKSETLRKQAERKRKVKFLIEMGANPNSVDKYGNDYKILMHKNWNKEFLELHNVIEQVEKVLK